MEQEEKENLFMTMMALPHSTVDLFEVLDQYAHPKRYVENYRSKVGRKKVNEPLPWPSLEEIAQKLPQPHEEILSDLRLLEEKGIINTQTMEVYLNTDLSYEEERVYEALCIQAYGKNHAILDSWRKIKLHSKVPRKNFMVILESLKNKGVIRISQEKIQDGQTGRIKKRHVCWFLTHPALEDMQAYFAQKYFRSSLPEKMRDRVKPPVSCRSQRS